MNVHYNPRYNAVKLNQRKTPHGRRRRSSGVQPLSAVVQWCPPALSACLLLDMVGAEMEAPLQSSLKEPQALAGFGLRTTSPCRFCSEGLIGQKYCPLNCHGLRPPLQSGTDFVLHTALKAYDEGTSGRCVNALLSPSAMPVSRCVCLSCL